MAAGTAASDPAAESFAVRAEPKQSAAEAEVPVLLKAGRELTMPADEPRSPPRQAALALPPRGKVVAGAKASPRSGV